MSDEKAIWFENVVIPKVTSFETDIDDENGHYLIIVHLEGCQSVLWRFLSFDEAHECEENLKLAVEDWWLN